MAASASAIACSIVPARAWPSAHIIRSWPSRGLAMRRNTVLSPRSLAARSRHGTNRGLLDLAILRVARDPGAGAGPATKSSNASRSKSCSSASAMASSWSAASPVRSSKAMAFSTMCVASAGSPSVRASASTITWSWVCRTMPSSTS